MTDVKGVLIGAYYDGWAVCVDDHRRHLRIEPPPGEKFVVYEYAGREPDGTWIFKADERASTGTGR